jgi:heat shock protein HtpX
MIITDDRIARRILRVIPLTPNEQPWLQATVAESSKKLGIACPKIAIVENLRPNAFTIGYGKNTTVVFSIGILNTLNKEELAAVALHELAHVKHHDFFFKTLISALTTVSFFNPVAFITASAAQRQREMYADEDAFALLDKPSTLSNALTKICNALKVLPEESIFTKASANLFVTSSILYRSDIFATHPCIGVRLHNISKQKSSTPINKKALFSAILLSAMLIFSFVLSSYAIVELQHTSITSVRDVNSLSDIGVFKNVCSRKSALDATQNGSGAVDIFGRGYVLRQVSGDNANFVCETVGMSHPHPGVVYSFDSANCSMSFSLSRVVV